MTRMKSRPGFVAVLPPIADKIESSVSSAGFVVNDSRTKTLSLPLIMDFKASDGTGFAAGDSVLVAGDAAFKPWAKKLYIFNDQPFVLVPEGEIIGYTLASEKA